MDKTEMIEYVDQICEQEGFTDSPAYDLIFSQCCEGRQTEDAKEMINEMLISYNR
jgi:pentatricopeptide repeat protein